MLSLAKNLSDYREPIVILAGLMLWYQMAPSIHILWVPLIVLYTLLVAMAMVPGAILTAFLPPLSHRFFKRAEA